MPKHVFFDLDNTLTPSKSHIRKEDAPILGHLAQKKDVIVVSGHGAKDIRAHLGEELSGQYHILGQSGNFAETKEGHVLWNNVLSKPQKEAILSFFRKIHDELSLPVKDENDLIEDRESQITYSLIGHHEDFDKKTAFDPGAKLRNQILAEHPVDVQKLRDVGIEAVPGGTTGIDFFLAGHNKGFNIGKFIEAMGWRKEDCLYVGDALFPGGNDETVVGVIPTHPVSGFAENFRYIQENLLT